MARITVEINGVTYTADSTAGPGRCGDCTIPHKGKACVWSMVCANVVDGAVFKVTQPHPGTPEGGGEKTEREDPRIEMYQKNRYNGD